MKKSLSLLLALFLAFSLFSQGETMKPIRLEVGYLFHQNALNEDNYFNFMSDRYSVQNTVMQGFNFKVSANYKENMDLIFGLMAENCFNEYSSGYSTVIANEIDYVLNGGGVYFGVNPHTNGKHFGVDADIAIGVFAYKEYRMIYNSESEPFLNVQDKKSSILGGMGTFGFYLKGKKLGISPEIQFLMAGGSNGSFLFYGLNLPLIIDL